MDSGRNKAAVVGGGPVGCVLAAMLARRGFEVDVYEKRPDMRIVTIDGDRSINLVLTRRGLRALGELGLRDEVLELTVPVLGRMMHSLEGELAFQPYGKDDSECNYSVSRGELNKFLLTAAEQAGARIHFDTAVTDADFDRKKLVLAQRGASETMRVSADVIFGADGAPSAVRSALVAHAGHHEQVDLLDYGYKELVFPSADGAYAMAGHALHIWPRGRHMLMGLANLDGSFTGTIYLPYEGEHGFDRLTTPQAVRAFFEAHYPDAISLLSEDFEREFLEHPTGTLGTVRCHPWHLDDRVLLVGDAAHAIVPFFGQGLNAGFEDCVVLDALFDELEGDLAQVFARFDAQRKPNADAIADMALENFVEMRDRVADEHFLLRKKVEARLEHELGAIYRTRYAMVMYSHNPYLAAFEIGKVQDAILRELMQDVATPEEVDLERARRLIEDRLVPLYEAHDVDLSF